MGYAKVKIVTDADFDSEVLQSERPTLVDFWAVWCGPCRMIAPIVEELASEYDGKLKVAKMNVDENPSTPGRYGIRAIPTLMIFKGGKIAEQVVGAVGKSKLVEAIDRVV
ncbi:MAG: thioredoxin [Vicinamibacteria bacterium]